MSATAEIRCRCGEVEGQIANASATTANRVVCHCDDCQAFLHHLGRADLLDVHGGSDIIQVAPASLTFRRGDERIVGLRLTAKGIARWYADCCKTPLGNTVGPAIPVVGIIAQAITRPDAIFGAPTGRIYGKFAIGNPPGCSPGVGPRVLVRTARRIVGWRLGGSSWPNPFFERATRAPSHPLTILSHAERDALRPFCGPRTS